MPIEAVKPFKTYDEQLSILKQRGMCVGDEQKALRTLKSENYYRLSGYWLTMLYRNPDGTEAFYPNASFENVLKLYQFDTNLRKTILSATMIIETNLKAFVAYYHGKKYGPCGYMKYENAEELWKHTSFMSALAADIKKRKDEAFVRHHDDDLGGIYPVWVATEVCSFDQVSKFYRNMLPADRQQIAKDCYGIASREYIESWLHCAVVARNMAAHGARFYNKPFFKPAAKLPRHLNQYGVTLFGYIYAIYYLLPINERENFLESICSCIESYDYVIIRHLGLPDGWKSLIKNGPRRSAPAPYPSEVRIAVERYLGYNWEWRVIATMINRVYGYSFTGTQLETLHAQHSQESSLVRQH